MINGCFQYFHVPGDDEKSQFRKNVVTSVGGALSSILEPLASPTYAFKSLDELEHFMIANSTFRVLPASIGRDYFLGELSLWAGWYHALQKFVNTDFDYLVIFEDDLWFEIEDNRGNTFIEVLIKEHLLPETHVVFLYSPEGDFPNYNEGLVKSEMLCEVYATWSAAFMLLTRSGAQEILNSISKGIDSILDFSLIKMAERLNIYALQPRFQRLIISIYDRVWLGSTIDPRDGSSQATTVTADFLKKFL